MKQKFILQYSSKNWIEVPPININAVKQWYGRICCNENHVESHFKNADPFLPIFYIIINEYILLLYYYSIILCVRLHTSDWFFMPWENKNDDERLMARFKFLSKLNKIVNMGIWAFTNFFCVSYESASIEISNENLICRLFLKF